MSGKQYRLCYAFLNKNDTIAYYDYIGRSAKQNKEGTVDFSCCIENPSNNKLITGNNNSSYSVIHRRFCNLLHICLDFWKSIKLTNRRKFTSFKRQLGSIVNNISYPSFLPGGKKIARKRSIRKYLATQNQNEAKTRTDGNRLTSGIFSEREIQQDNPKEEGQQRMMYLINFVPSRGLFDPSAQAAIDAIQGQPTQAWWHFLRDTWIIVTPDSTATDVYNRLQPHLLQDRDKLLIVSINAGTNYQGLLPQEAWTWIETQKNSNGIQL
jgi:hypothetical protein